MTSDDVHAAFAELAWPRGKQVGELAPHLERLAALARRRGATELAELAEQVVRDPDSPDRLYDLGYALIDAGAPEIAASVLWRCLALVGDSEEVVCELVSALESALAYGDALAILDAHASLRARSFLCRYLYAFDAAMTARLDVARAQLPALEPDGPDQEVMRATIAGMLARADRVAGACPLDRADLRGWHYVLTGGVLLHQSPYGFDGPMRGRYAWLHDSLSRIATGLDRVAALVEAAPPPCVYAPPGPHHESVAHAAAARLGLALAPWPAVGTPAPGLIVAYDLDAVAPGELARIAQRRDGQVFFAHACPWTHDSPVAPDVATLLYQSLQPPWPDAGDPGERALEILASPRLDLDELAADEPERYAALVARAWPHPPGPRSRLWGGGPVPSNRF